MQRLLVLAISIGLAALAGCNSAQRNGALAAVRDIQQTGVAQAAEAPGAELPLPQSPEGDASGSESIEAPAQGDLGPPPGGPPPGAPPPGGPGMDPPAGAPPAGDPAAAAAPAEPAKTPEQVIKDFVDSDPRDILEEKSKDLKDRQTHPWDDEKPETFIPETGRKDPMTIVQDSVPDELLPERGGDEDESQLETYLFTLFATQAMQQVTNNLTCHSVIQIGITKYAQMSFGDGRRFPISEGNGFNQTYPGPVPLQVSLQIASISTTEIVVDINVNPQGTNVNVSKQVVFIPRM